PVELTVDLDRWKARRQRAAGHHVLGLDGTVVGIEVDEIAAAHVHSADAEPHLAGVEVIEIDQTFERAAQLARVIVAGRLDRSGRKEERRRNARGEESGRALDQRTTGLELIEKAPRLIAAPI